MKNAFDSSTNAAPLVTPEGTAARFAELLRQNSAEEASKVSRDGNFLRSVRVTPEMRPIATIGVFDGMSVEVTVTDRGYYNIATQMDEEVFSKFLQAMVAGGYEWNGEFQPLPNWKKTNESFITPRKNFLVSKRNKQTATEESINKLLSIASRKEN